MSDVPPGVDPYGGAYGQQPPDQQQYGVGGYGEPAPRSNGIAIAALVVGILAVLAIITIIGGVVLGLVAIVLGAIGLAKAGRLRSGRGLAIAGIVLGALAVIISVGLVAVGITVAREFIEQAPTEELEFPVEYDGVIGG